MPKPDWIDLCNAANAAYEAEKMEIAYEQALEAYHLAKAEHGDDLIEYADIIYLLSIIYLEQEQYLDAHPLIEALLSLDKTWENEMWETGAQRDFYLDAIECWLGLASQQMDRHLFAEAEDHLLRAMQLIQAKHLEKESIALLDEIGALYELSGRFTQAENSYRLALNQLTENDFPDHRFYQIKLANVLSLQGKYKDADGLFVAAITHIKEKLGEDSLDYIWSLERYLPHLQSLQQHSLVLTYALHCLETYRKQLGKEHPSYLSAAQEVARIAMHAGIYDDVETVLLECKATYEKIESEDISYFSLLLQLGIYYRNTHQFDKAEAYIKQSMHYVADKIGKQHPAFASALSNLAGLYEEKGNIPAAISCFKENLALNKIIYGSSHPSYATTLEHLGNTCARMSDLQQALRYYQQSCQIRYNQLNQLFVFQSETERMRIFDLIKQTFTRFNLLASQCINQQPDLTCKIFDNWLFIKAALFQTNKTFKTSAEHISDAETLRLYKKWIRNTRYFAKLYDYSNTDDDHHNYLLQLKRKIDQDEKKLLQRLTDFNPSEASNIDFEQVRGALRSGEAVIEIQRLAGIANLEGRYIALLVTRQTKAPILVELGLNADIEDTQLTDYRKYLNQYGGGRSLRRKRSSGLNDKKIQLSTSLYTALWQPLATVLRENNINGRVYLSADGIYNQLNINTLINPKSGHFVLDEWDIYQVTSSRELLDLKTYPGKKNASNTAVLLGYPAYYMSIPYEVFEQEHNPDEITPKYEYRHIAEGKIQELPGTKEEIESLNTLFAEAGWETTVLLGKSATESAVKRMQGARVLHMATHGFFLPSGTIDQNKPADIPVNALFHTGLLFAGAGLSLKGRKPEGVFYQLADNEDGIFSAYEASLLDMKETELVVLSACETGLGVLRNGEGVYGFQRAFFEAGAHCLLCSLWKIDDMATKEMMQLFYSFWLSGLSKRRAFKKAQQELRNSWPSPYYWGAFVMFGN